MTAYHNEVTKAVARMARVPIRPPPWAPVLRRDPCSYCGGPGGTVDHIVPQAAGAAKVARVSRRVQGVQFGQG